MKRAGFSLVELSIVLVILGLLAGGILAGRSLIRASELRAVGTEWNRYQTAIAAFRDKYFAFPGDMGNATNFWGTAGSCPGTNGTPSSTAATCNGDGDGVIECTSPTVNEVWRFWQHLTNAGMVEGQFTAVPGPTNYYEATLGVNVPRSELANAGWAIHDRTGAQTVSLTYLFEGNYTNILAFGGSSGGAPDAAIMRAEEAWNIDTKLDDGKPGVGKIRTYEQFTNCHDAGTSITVALATTANYSLGSTVANACALLFSSQ